MTIMVRTTDGETLEFSDADDWETGVDGQDEGTLWVGVRETGEGVAQFAPGAWAFVYEQTELEPEYPEDGDITRQWDELKYVPWASKVKDNSGDIWEYDFGNGCWTFRDSDDAWEGRVPALHEEVIEGDYDAHAPFVEIEESK